MPIYEYRCEACGHGLETLQKLSDAPLTDCPECGKPALKKLISPSAFRLKGGGWYETDFKTGAKKNVAGEKQAKSGGKATDTAKSGDKSAGTAKSGTAGKKD